MQKILIDGSQLVPEGFIEILDDLFITLHAPTPCCGMNVGNRTGDREEL
jgi:hypothetical protein